MPAGGGRPLPALPQPRAGRAAERARGRRPHCAPAALRRPRRRDAAAGRRGAKARLSARRACAPFSRRLSAAPGAAQRRGKLSVFTPSANVAGCWGFPGLVKRGVVGWCCAAPCGGGGQAVMRVMAGPWAHHRVELICSTGRSGAWNVAPEREWPVWHGSAVRALH